MLLYIVLIATALPASATILGFLVWLWFVMMGDSPRELGPNAASAIRVWADIGWHSTGLLFVLFSPALLYSRLGYDTMDALYHGIGTSLIVIFLMYIVSVFLHGAEKRHVRRFSDSHPKFSSYLQFLRAAWLTNATIVTRYQDTGYSLQDICDEYKVAVVEAKTLLAQDVPWQTIRYWIRDIRDGNTARSFLQAQIEYMETIIASDDNALLTVQPPRANK